MGWLMLDELPAPAAYLGGALCIVGVVLTRRTPRAVSAPERDLEELAA